jgi:pilus assembly protein CpaF
MLGMFLAPLDSSAHSALAERVRERLRQQGTDPTRDPETAARVVQAELRRHNDAALAQGAATIDDEAAAVRDVLAAVGGFGPLQPYLDDPTIEEIWINGPDRKLSSST